MYSMYFFWSKMIANELYPVYHPTTSMFDEDLACFIYCNLYSKAPNSNTKNIRKKMFMSYTDTTVTFVFLDKTNPSICSMPRARFDSMKEKYSKSHSICAYDICGVELDKNDMFAPIPDEVFKWEIKP